jgi:hypothetical protein
MVTVVTQGKHIDPAAVYRELGIKPFVDGGPRWVETGPATPSGASSGR